MRAVNPATGELIREYPEHAEDEVAAPARARGRRLPRVEPAPRAPSGPPCCAPWRPCCARTSPPTPRS